MRVVLVGCEAARHIEVGWGHRLRVFENRGLRKMFGSKRDEVTGDWKQLHNEALYDLH